MALERRVVTTHDQVVKTDLLEGSPLPWLPRQMAPGVKQRLAALGRSIDVAAGATVVSEGEPCAGLGVVLYGRVAIRVSIPGGGQRTLITVDEGDLYGWSTILPESIATATGVAIVDTKAVLFERAALEAALAADCELAAAVYQWVLGAVTRRLQATRMQLLDLYQSGSRP